MKRKGIDFRPAPHLTWREAQEGDLDAVDEQVHVLVVGPDGR